MTTKTLAAALLGLAAASALAAPNAADRRFVHAIAFGNAFEAQGGRLALKRSDNAGLRDYGTMLVSMHGHAQGDLAKIARAKGLTLPGGLTAADQKLVAKLASLKGEAFNRSYKLAVLAHHRHALEGIRREIRQGRDREILAYAQRMRTMVLGHIARLEAIRV